MEDFIWSGKYRPQTVADCILPVSMMKTFTNFVKDGNVPNLLLSGGPGCGKTTVAKAMLHELGCQFMVINASLNGNIDTLRNEISSFASSISFSGGRKYVILDEADYLNPNSTQPALRNFMDEFSTNCGFILTANYPGRIIEPLRSRLSEIKFDMSQEGGIAKLGAQFFKAACVILDKEGVEHDKKAVAELVKKHYPDFRKVINELQTYAKTGRIDAGILAKFSDENFNQLVGFLKTKNFKAMRLWCGENIDMEVDVILRTVYDKSYDFLKPQTIPPVVLILARYGYQNAFCADREINLVACLTEIMIEAEFN